MAKQYSDPELGQMPNVNDTGLNDRVIMKKVAKRVGSKSVPRKTAPKAVATRLIRGTTPIKAPAQGNSASTTPGISKDAMMAAAKKLLNKK